MTIPPLLMLAEGRKPRLRRAATVRPKEIGLHMAVAALLRNHARPDWQWTHVAHGEARDPRTAAKLRQMGLRPGWPDFVLIPPTGQLHCLELKRAGEKPSEPQEAFRFWCIRHNTPYVVATDMPAVRLALSTWGCLAIDVALLGGLKL